MKISDEFRRFKNRNRILFRRKFIMELYGRRIALDTLDRRAFLLSKREDGQGLQPDLIRMVKDYVAQMNDVIFFDIGANYGEWTLALRDIVKTSVAIEPHPRLAKLLKLNFQGLLNIEVQQIALAADDGEAVLHYRRGYSGGSSLSPAHLARLDPKVWWGIGRMAKTRIIAREAEGFLGEVFDRHTPEVRSVALKIDIEGGEGAILGALSGFLEKLNDWLLVIEFNPQSIEAVGQDSGEIWKILRRLGACRVVPSGEDRESECSLEEIPIADSEPLFSCDVIVLPCGRKSS